MVREVVSVHVGQCGLQLGSSFWHQVRGEHTRQQRREQRADHTAKAGKDSIGGGRGGRADSGAAGQSSEWWRWSASSAPLSASVDDSVSTFFHPLDSDAGPSSPFPYRARAVLVDMESGVLSALARSSQSSLFDSAVSVVSDVSGSGNNWAHGYCVFGPQYGRPVLECVRRQSEQCDSLQAFILTHSTGGGTGSGLGSYILEQLADEYSGVYRLDQCVLPSLERDDVVTSPYNAALSLPAIVRSADVVLPLDNQALVDICDGFHKSQQSPQQTATQLKHQLQQHSRPRTAASTASPSPPPPSVIGGGFSELNVLCASVLSCLTAGMRFPGELNVDLSDLVMNCCPFTDTNLLVPALSPLHATLQYHYTHDDGSTQSHQPLQQAGLEKATGRPALASRRRVDPSTGVQVANSLAAAPASSAAETSYYFHTVDTAQSLHSAQSTARHSVSAFGSSTRSPAVRGDMDAMQGGRTGGQHNDALFHTALQTSHQLLQMSPLSGTYLSCALLCRGDISLGSVQRQVDLLSAQMSFASVAGSRDSRAANASGGSWKLGLCSVPAQSAAGTVLALSNNSAVAPRLQAVHDRCLSLFARRAHWHHYLDCGLEEQHMTDSLSHIRDTVAAYTAFAQPSSTRLGTI